MRKIIGYGIAYIPVYAIIGLMFYDLGWRQSCLILVWMGVAAFFIVIGVLVAEL